MGSHMTSHDSESHAHNSNGNDGHSLGESALKGALAALVGGLALKMLWNAGQHTLPSSERFPSSPTREAVDILASRRGINLSSTETAIAAGLVYGGVMATWGALYGVAQDRLHPPRYLNGLLMAGMVYGTNFTRFGGLPKLGITEPAGEQPKRKAAVPLAAHVGFGLATAAAFEALS